MKAVESRGLDVSDYCHLFDLSENELKSHLLMYGCGVTNANDELSHMPSIEHYVPQEPLPFVRLPFDDFAFDLALSAYTLFDSNDMNEQLFIITELARVAKEVRIFPLMNKEGQTYSLLGPILLKLQENNYGVEIREVAHHLQPENKAMLRVWAQLCQV